MEVVGLVRDDDAFDSSDVGLPVFEELISGVNEVSIGVPVVVCPFEIAGGVAEVSEFVAASIWDVVGVWEFGDVGDQVSVPGVSASDGSAL